jgi:hypothetical protein
LVLRGSAGTLFSVGIKTINDSRIQFITTVFFVWLTNSK